MDEVSPPAADSRRDCSIQQTRAEGTGAGVGMDTMDNAQVVVWFVCVYVCVYVCM